MASDLTVSIVAHPSPEALQRFHVYSYPVGSALQDPASPTIGWPTWALPISVTWVVCSGTPLTTVAVSAVFVFVPPHALSTSSLALIV